MRKLASTLDILNLVHQWGFLPFFANAISGFSIQERISARYWFPASGDGVWEWKGPIIRTGRVAYGKFFRKKALFVDLKWLPDFLNVRRSIPLNRVESYFLEVLRGEGSLVSKDWRALVGFARHHNTALSLFGDGEAISEYEELEPLEHSRSDFDAVVANLQMAGRVVIEDFEYARNKAGQSYGWGLARYTTPETLYADHMLVDCPPEESAHRILSHLKGIFPETPSGKLRALLYGRSRFPKPETRL